ncbi:MAG: hypothetical protein HUJ94_06980 [Bacteroidales bacterium]|nr:hypothetical protein [Bacteroidales bacterium]
MADTEYLDQFEKILEDGLVKICTTAGLLKDGMMSSPDIDEAWENLYLKDYVADAVENYGEYPEAAIAWAAFLGMSVASSWDRDWAAHDKDPYQMHYGRRGFDDMDEHVMYDILGLDADKAKYLSDCIQSCAQATLTLIRHEHVQPLTSDEFYVLVRCYGVMFRIGAAVELDRLGYRKMALTQSKYTN